MENFNDNNILTNHDNNEITFHDSGVGMQNVACDDYLQNNHVTSAKYHCLDKINMDLPESPPSIISNTKKGFHKKKSKVLFAEKVAERIPSPNFILGSEESLVYLETNIDSLEMGNIKPTDIDEFASSGRISKQLRNETCDHLVKPNKSEKYIKQEIKFDSSDDSSDNNEVGRFEGGRVQMRSNQTVTVTRGPYFQELGNI